MKKSLYAGLLIFCMWQAYANGKEEAKSMADHYSIQKIHKIIAIHYQTMDQKKEPDKILLFDEANDTKRIADLLQQLSSKGSIFKSWPPNIPTIQVIILHDDQKYCILRIDNSRLQRPDGGGYGLEDFKKVKKLVDILKKADNVPDEPAKE